MTIALIASIAGTISIISLGVAFKQWSTQTGRERLVRWLDVKAYAQSSPVDSYLKSKAAVYEIIASMSRGPALRLLNEVSREMICGDPRLDVGRAQTQVADLSQIATKLTSSEFIFLCLEAVDHTVVTQLSPNSSDSL